jgi:glycerol-3-phosphate dehydrogenase
LVKPPEEDGHVTKGISREHTIVVSRSGLVTVTGGKWTTYRAMAEDVLARCMADGRLPQRAKGATQALRLVGAKGAATAWQSIAAAPGAMSYGDEQAMLATLPGADITLAHGMTEAMVRFAARYEYAVTVEDVLARRSRLLFLDAALARQLAAKVGSLLEAETGLPPQVAAFEALAQQYLLR